MIAELKSGDVPGSGDAPGDGRAAVAEPTRRIGVASLSASLLRRVCDAGTLPFETTANTIIAGDEKLIHFRYFFTRKLMFLFHADAVVLFPGGFGTMDEAFETLTLIQTGKAAMMPISGTSSGFSVLLSRRMA